MRKFIIRFFTFLSFILLVGGLIFIYTEFYPVESREDIALSEENKDSTEFVSDEDLNSDKEESNTNEIDEGQLDDEIFTEITALEEFEESDDIYDSKERSNQSLIELSDKVNSELREYDFDRINTYEDYVPVIPLSEIDDNLIGATFKTVGTRRVSERYKDGQLTVLEHNDNSIRVQHESSNYYGHDYGETIGILSKDSSGYIITSDYLSNDSKEYETNFEEAYTLTPRGLKGEIIKKEVSSEGHINLTLHDQNRKEFEVNIANVYNPIPNHFSVNQNIIIEGGDLNRSDNKIEILSLSNIQRPLEDEKPKIHNFDADDIIVENWGEYGVINVNVKDMNKYSDNTVYLLLENQDQIIHGTILKQSPSDYYGYSDEPSEEMEDRIDKLESAMANEQDIKLLGLINIYNDIVEFIILDAFH